jgi:Family of unknown function (DUF6527)
MRKTLTPEFVGEIPRELEDGVLYVSMDFATVVHSCACGCGGKVVTPLSPTDWHITYDGEGVSLSPSVGNWSFPCRSHYVIQANRVLWAPPWSAKQIEAGRALDRARKDAYYRDARTSQPGLAPEKATRIGRLRRWLRRAT